MPKEYIYSENHGREAVIFEETAEGQVPRTEVLDWDAVKVSWSKESDSLQIAVVDYAKDPDGFEARHISLDRNGANRLVRFLRRGRDDAFGKDE